jgi:hypothetical protein
MKSIPLIVVLVSYFPSQTFAQNLTGLCLDMREAGCMDRHIPFSGNTIDFCEESCTLTTPVAVRGLDAALYDLQCRGDYGAIPDRRVLLLAQQDPTYGPRTLWVDAESTLEIVPCP